jgi:putative hydrolase of the HAD superfamily
MSARATNDDAPRGRLSAVFLDAGGTLLTEEPPRVEIYRGAAARRGIEVSAPYLRDLMYRTHAELPRSLGEHFRYSQGWFRTFIARIFRDHLGLASRELGSLEDELFTRFADPRTFRLFPGAIELARDLRARGLRVGVLSNWSESLPGVLAGLGLDRELDFVLVSAVERCEKPEPEIFQRALARAGVDAAHALHAGDDLVRDVQGARAVGILPVLVRSERGAASTPDTDDGTARVADLIELKQWILERL